MYKVLHYEVIFYEFPNQRLLNLKIPSRTDPSIPLVSGRTISNLPRRGAVFLPPIPKGYSTVTFVLKERSARIKIY
jgi:hypothetical protein